MNLEFTLNLVSISTLTNDQLKLIDKKLNNVLLNESMKIIIYETKIALTEINLKN